MVFYLPYASFLALVYSAYTILLSTCPSFLLLTSPYHCSLLGRPLLSSFSLVPILLIFPRLVSDLNFVRDSTHPPQPPHIIHTWANFLSFRCCTIYNSGLSQFFLPPSASRIEFASNHLACVCSSNMNCTLHMVLLKLPPAVSRVSQCITSLQREQTEDGATSGHCSIDSTSPIDCQFTSSPCVGSSFSTPVVYSPQYLDSRAHGRESLRHNNPEQSSVT